MAMVAVTTALIGFFAFVIMRVTTPQMTTLFTDLSVEDSSGIIKDLERQAIPFELRNEGAVIMVPKDKVTRLRLKLAEGGLPKGGGVGYEIFDKSDALGKLHAQPRNLVLRHHDHGAIVAQLERDRLAFQVFDDAGGILDAEIGKEGGHLRCGDAHDDKGEEADQRGCYRDHRHQPRRTQTF